MMSADGRFLLTLVGQLEWIDITAAADSSWYCKYEIVSGPDWQIISGIDAGISQTANVMVNGDKIVLNFPIEIAFKSTNPSGWPQIVLSLYSGTVLQGYSRSYFPFQPGFHTLDLPLSKPQPSTFLGYIASFFGYQPELIRPSLLATVEGSYLIKTISNGTARISVNVLTKGLKELGYDVGLRRQYCKT